MTDVYIYRLTAICVRAKGLSIPDFRSSREKEVTTSVQRAPCERVYTVLLPAVRKKGRRCEEFVNPSQGKKDEIIQDFPPFPRVPELRKPGETPPPLQAPEGSPGDQRATYIGGHGLVTGSVSSGRCAHPSRLHKYGLARDVAVVKVKYHLCFQ